MTAPSLNRRRAGFLLVPLLSLLLGACSDDEVWGEARTELADRMRTGNHAFLRHIDYDSVRLSDVERLGPGAGYYLALIYRGFGLDAVAVRLAEIEAEEGEALWDLRAGELAAEMHADAGAHASALRVAEKTGRDFPDAERPRQQRGAALYELGRFEDVLEYVIETYAGGQQVGSLAELRTRAAASELPSPRPETMLWWIVARYELDIEGWAEDVVHFFREVDAVEAHSRLELYISYRSEVAAAFRENERNLFLAKRLLADGDFDAAYEVYAGIMAAMGPMTEPTTPMARDFSRAALGADTMIPAADVLAAAAGEADSPLAGAMRFEAGRLYRWAGAYRRAVSVLEDAVSDTEVYGRQRVVWYYLSSLVRSDPEAAVTAITAESRRFEDPRYFSDLFEELIGALAEMRRWDLLWLLYQANEAYISRGTASHLEVLLARLVASGAVEVAESRRGALVDELLAAAAEQTENVFYHLVASASLGRSLFVPPAPASEIEQESTAAYEFLLGFFAFGLADEAYRESRFLIEQLGADEIMHIGDLLADRGLVNEALRLHVRARSGFPPDDALARRLYPAAYQATIKDAAETYGIPVSVLFALVREESYFDPAAVSHAGAVGLAQIMPETAGDLAARMRMAEAPDLTDATTSIQMGAYYLGNLSERFEPVSRALAAYNGGQGRVRRWEAERDDLDSVLFFETIPYAETRGYIRKVLVSAVFYGYLYEQISSETTVRGFFPDL